VPGLYPDLLGSLQRSPDLLAGFEGPTSKVRGGEERGDNRGEEWGNESGKRGICVIGLRGWTPLYIAAAY